MLLLSRFLILGMVCMPVGLGAMIADSVKREASPNVQENLPGKKVRFSHDHHQGDVLTAAHVLVSLDSQQNVAAGNVPVEPLNGEVLLPATPLIKDVLSVNIPQEDAARVDKTQVTQAEYLEQVADRIVAAHEQARIKCPQANYSLNDAVRLFDAYIMKVGKQK